MAVTRRFYNKYWLRTPYHALCCTGYEIICSSLVVYHNCSNRHPQGHHQAQPLVTRRRSSSQS